MYLTLFLSVQGKQRKGNYSLHKVKIFLNSLYAFLDVKINNYRLVTYFWFICYSGVYLQVLVKGIDVISSVLWKLRIEKELCLIYLL